LLRAFAEVFPHVAVFWTETLEVLVIGSERPLVLNVDRVRAALASAKVGDDLRAIGIHDTYDVLADFLFDEAALWSLVASQPPITDDQPLVEYRPAGTLDQNWKVINLLLQHREQPQHVASRFGLSESEALLLAARMRERIHERFVIGPGSSRGANR
jgi:hypothetical protein